MRERHSPVEQGARRASRRCVFAAACLLALAPLSAVAYDIGLWPADLPITTAPGDQGLFFPGYQGLTAVSDGAGGAFIVWHDRRLDSIFLQTDDRPIEGDRVAIQMDTWLA